MEGIKKLFHIILDLVWMRLFRPVRAIAEPWDEGDGIEWAKMAVDRVLAVAVWDANPGAMPGKAPKRLAATSPGGRLEDRHIPGGRQSPGPC